MRVSVTVNSGPLADAFHIDLDRLMATDDGLREQEAEIRAALDAGEVYRGGGGAAPSFSIRPQREAPIMNLRHHLPAEALAVVIQQDWDDDTVIKHLLGYVQADALGLAPETIASWEARLAVWFQMCAREVTPWPVLPTYHVTWEADIDAPNAVEAAREARRWQQELGALAFTVARHGADGKLGEGVTVDLQEAPR